MKVELHYRPIRTTDGGMHIAAELYLFVEEANKWYRTTTGLPVLSDSGRIRPGTGSDFHTDATILAFLNPHLPTWIIQAAPAGDPELEHLATWEDGKIRIYGLPPLGHALSYLRGL